MCYICEMQGHVGRNYKAARRAISAALKVWGRKKPTMNELPLGVTWAAFRGPKPEGGDWLKAPIRAQPWTARDFEKYQANPYVAMSFPVLPRVHRL